MFAVFVWAGIILATAAPAHAGAWLQPVGDVQVIATSDYTTASSAFNDDREDAFEVSFEKVEARVYAEAGLSERFTLIAEGTYQDVIFDGLEGKSRFTGPSKAGIGGRVPLLSSGGYRISLEADAAYQRGGEFVSDGELDYRGFSTSARALYGYGWDRAYVDVQAGYIARFQGIPDSWTANITAGYDVTGRLSVSASAFGQTTGSDRLGTDRILATESLKIKGAVLYDLRNSTLEIGLLHTVAGRNLVRETGITVSTWRRF